MYDLLFYLELGLFHVLDWNAYDHLLFLVVLTIPFSSKEIKTVFWIVTFFTLGHTISLFISVYELYAPPEKIIEILIPITIIIAGINNLLKSNVIHSFDFNSFLISTLFGIVHGFGFGNFFNQISFPLESKVKPLTGFALGVEVSQLIIVVCILLINWVVIKLIPNKLSKYIIVVSSIIIGFALSMTINLL